VTINEKSECPPPTQAGNIPRLFAAPQRPPARCSRAGVVEVLLGMCLAAEADSMVGVEVLLEMARVVVVGLGPRGYVVSVLLHHALCS
jgi:hypothetical protein